MVRVPSVTGLVPAEALGAVLVHEHVAISSAGILRSWPGLAGHRAQLLDRAVGILARAREDGISTIVDATTFDLGRDMELLAEAARRSGVHIIASTGHWLMPSPTMAARTVGELTDFFITELTEGADGTAFRPWVIKVASEDTVTDFEARVLESAARAHLATGAPILTHTHARSRIGERQAEVFERFGVDPARVVIGHSDDTDDIEYLAGLAARGHLIGMDRLPNGALPEYGGQSVADRLDMIVRLVDRGFHDRIVLSHDDPIWAGLLSAEDQRRHLASNPDIISFIPRVALPALVERGLSDARIRELMVENPRRWLSGPG